MDKFIDKLIPHHIAVLCNVLDGLDAGLYDLNFVRTAMGCWREAFLRSQAALPTKSEEEQLNTALAGLAKQDIPTGSKLRLKCPNPLLEHEHPQSYAHNMSSEGFVRHALHNEDKLYLAALSAITNLGKPLSLSGNPISKPVRLKALGENRGVVFITPFDDVAPLLDRPTKAADIRDKVGLVHWEKDKDYVMLELGAAELSGLPQGRPTFVDAGFHRRFKAVATHAANKTKSNWGYTLDLNAFATTGGLADGVRERVCEQIGAHNMLSIKLHPLGPLIAANRGIMTDEDAQYAGVLLGARSKENIEKRMKEIV